MCRLFCPFCRLRRYVEGCRRSRSGILTLSRNPSGVGCLNVLWAARGCTSAATAQSLPSHPGPLGTAAGLDTPAAAPRCSSLRTRSAMGSPGAILEVAIRDGAIGDKRWQVGLGPVGPQEVLRRPALLGSPRVGSIREEAGLWGCPVCRR